MSDRLAARLTQTARVLDEAAERLLSQAAADADIELAAADPRKAPLKHRLRSIEDPDRRDILLLALRRRQQRYVLEQIAGGSVTWNRPIARKARYGVGLDERSVELPLAVEALEPERSGRALDAGASLNLSWLRKPGQWSVRILHVTQSAAFEKPVFDGDRVGYLFADLRDLPLKARTFDRVLCISTLEHVGMDNRRYGAADEHDPDSALAAVSELKRVLAPGGVLLLTVPFGRPHDLGWFRVFGKRELNRVRALLDGMDLSERWFQYAGSWFDDKPARILARDRADGVVRGLAVLAARKRG